MRKPGLAGALAAGLLLLAVSASSAPPRESDAFTRRGHTPERLPVARVIVGLRESRSPAAAASMQAIARRSGMTFQGEREIAPALRVVELEAPVSGTELDAALEKISSDPEVAFAEPDQRVYRHAVSADALFPGQWYLQSAQVSAIDAAAAWDVTTGSSGTVVAVLDTGVRFEHPDLLRAGQGGRLLPGRDFVGPDPGGGFRVANDGDGWDADASDPGDWVSDSDAQLPVFQGCEPEGSSWHGTRVAGMVGAITNNGEGIAGATWQPWILPVRVLGKCFGNNSDILQAMRWAAGLHVAGVPENPYPAKVVNMSLGAAGVCTAAYRSVIEELAGVGVLVVASAGNWAGGPVEVPANCPGAVGVAGLRHVGTKVGFSSIGPEITVSAPGGNCVNTSPGAPCLFSLDTTVNTGDTAPAASAYTDPFNVNVGTSFAAPSVAAIAALMHAVNGNLDAAQLRARIREGARSFPPPSSGIPLCHVPVDANDVQLECGCTSDTCGAGMAYAPGGVAAALRPIAAVALPGAVTAGQNVTLDASGSAAACNRTIAAYQWTAVSGAPVISGVDTAVATVVAPPADSFTVRVTITDEQGAQDIADVTVTADSALTAAPDSAGVTACPAAISPADPGTTIDEPNGGGGGGGSSGLELLLIFAGACACRGLIPNATHRQMRMLSASQLGPRRAAGGRRGGYRLDRAQQDHAGLAVSPQC